MAKWGRRRDEKGKGERVCVKPKGIRDERATQKKRVRKERKARKKGAKEGNYV